MKIIKYMYKLAQDCAISGKFKKCSNFVKS